MFPMKPQMSQRMPQKLSRMKSQKMFQRMPQRMFQMMSKKMSRIMSQMKYLPEGEILQEPHSERGRFRKENPGKPDTGEMKAA